MDDIRQISKKVRKTLETFVISHDSVDEDYHKDESLGCMCAVASVFLANILQKHGFNANVRELKFGYMSHCFVEYNNIVIDLTATQLRNVKRKVVIMPIMKYLNWIVSKEFGRMPTLKEFNEKTWPEEQSPRKEIINKLEEIHYANT
jgi:hypothetical protein